MLSFASDYTTGAHPKILERLIETNLEPASGYGSDPYCRSAEKKIREACQSPYSDIFFLVGGTQTNQVVISTMLGNEEGVVAARTGHVSVHEAGAIEYTGHKVLTVESNDGKLSAVNLRAYLREFYADDSHEHMVYPGMVYISYPTEYGTLYSRLELERIKEVCTEFNIPLFVDGARLGYGLASPEANLTMAELAELCDVFYIGGTKVGALCGEAVVFTHSNAPKHFITQVKQHGALLAKGRLLGVQFDTLFTDGLYMEISHHAIEMAQKMNRIFKECGYTFFLESPTNQQFILLRNDRMEELAKKVVFSIWEPFDDDHTVVRFATSWSTTEEDLEELRKVLQ